MSIDYVSRDLTFSGPVFPSVLVLLLIVRPMSSNIRGDFFIRLSPGAFHGSVVCGSFSILYRRCFPWRRSLCHSARKYVVMI